MQYLRIIMYEIDFSNESRVLEKNLSIEVVRIQQDLYRARCCSESITQLEVVLQNMIKWSRGFARRTYGERSGRKTSRNIGWRQYC